MSVLQDAFREAARREFTSVPAEEALNYSFSDSFKERVEELISGQKRNRCFFIGHRDAPNTLEPLLDEAIETSVSVHHINQFVVGHYGSFDKMATRALVRAKKRHPELQLLCLTPYHPSERMVELLPEFNGTLYPEGMELVPKQYAIVHANQYMVDHCDRIIAYVCMDGSSAGKILRQAKKRGIVFVNLAEVV